MFFVESLETPTGDADRPTLGGQSELPPADLPVPSADLPAPSADLPAPSADSVFLSRLIGVIVVVVVVVGVNIVFWMLDLLLLSVSASLTSSTTIKSFIRSRGTSPV